MYLDTAIYGIILQVVIVIVGVPVALYFAKKRKKSLWQRYMDESNRTLNDAQVRPSDIGKKLSRLKQDFEAGILSEEQYVIERKKLLADVSASH